MRNTRPAVIAAILIALSGCAVRSISDSDDDRNGRFGRSAGSYQGELSEFDVLGIDRASAPSDVEISRALDNREAVKLRNGSKVLLIQSGAIFPDEAMTKAVAKQYSVGVFTGVPANASDAIKPGSSMVPANYARSLRLAAAQGGYENLIVYWGVLESARENLATSTVSWFPIVGWVLPDERQRMRIRLKMTVIDVRTGQWEMFVPEPFEDKSISSMLSRRDTDQAQVGLLKERAYSRAAEELFGRFNR